MDDVFICISGMSMIISVDPILISLLPVESLSAITVIGSFSKLWMSVDRCWVSNVDRWSSVLLHEEILCSISLSRYMQCVSIYCSCIAFWIPENTKLIWC